jgi:hypothetical protein
MQIVPRLLVSLSLLAAASIPARAEEILLRPQHRAGDAYALSLRTTTQSDIRSKRRSAKAENVQLSYTADVVILETDAGGMPIRERHERAQLRFERSGETGALFRDGAVFEVRRDADGDVQLFANDVRLDRKIESLIADVLATQFEYTLAPALLQPDRSVEVGDTWRLDPQIARKLLRTQGVRVVAFAGPAMATLERGPDDGTRVIRYRIPIDRWVPDDLPVNAQTAQSDAQIEGEIRVSAEPGPAAFEHRAQLAASLHGVVTAPGVAAPLPWRMERAHAAEQSTRPLDRKLAAAF